MRPTAPALPFAALLGLLAALPAPARAAEAYDNCKGYIDALPATISTQGVWCLRKDVNSNLESGAAIEVTVNNVTIDCNDFKAGNLLASTANTASAVRAVLRSNITVRRCNLRGYGSGVTLIEGSGHLVEDNRFDNSRQEAIYLSGNGSTIRRNFLIDGISEAQGMGILAYGNHDILDNTIDTIYGESANSFAIYLGASDRSTVRGNRIRTVTAGAEGYEGYGIYVDNAASLGLIADNYLNSGGSEVPATIGIACNFGDSVVRGNTITGFATPTQGCFDDGGNVSR